MNKLIIILSVLFFSCTNQNFEFKDLVGEWRITAVVTYNDTLEVPHKPGYKSRFEFYQDSTFIYVLFGRELKGEWLLSDLDLDLDFTGRPKELIELTIHTRDSINLVAKFDDIPIEFFIIRE